MKRTRSHHSKTPFSTLSSQKSRPKGAVSSERRGTNNGPGTPGQCNKSHWCGAATNYLSFFSLFFLTYGPHVDVIFQQHRGKNKNGGWNWLMLRFLGVTNIYIKCIIFYSKVIYIYIYMMYKLDVERTNLFTPKIIVFGCERSSLPKAQAPRSSMAKAKPEALTSQTAQGFNQQKWLWPEVKNRFLIRRGAHVGFQIGQHGTIRFRPVQVTILVLEAWRGW